MSTPHANEGTPSTNLPPPSPKPSGPIKRILTSTGIPPSWLDKRPRLPSRNWLIFLSGVSSVLGLYYYDRRECKRIRREFVDRVKHLSERSADTMEWPRKVTVYGCKWPGDEDYGRSLKYFRKYVKPILVAAAVDYETVNGERHGDLARTIADRVKARRRLALGLDQPSPDPMPLPTHRTPDEKRRHEVEGGTVIVGRHTLKEFMAGLKWGWTGTLAKVDTEELVARELQDDPVFDELEEEGERTEDAPHAPPSEKRDSPSPPNLPIYSPLQHMHPLTKRPKPESSLHESVVDEPPALIPQQPPLLLVPFTNHIGFTQIPYMLWDFFNERKRVRDGGEAAYRLIMKNTRPFVGSSPSIPDDETSSTADASTQSDLDFDKKAESYYRRSLSSTLSTIEKARNKYLKELPTRLKVARDLARGVREPTKDEWNNPPSTEVELRAERMRKEVRWRKDKEGWDIVRPDSETSWDERFDGALSVFVDPPSDDPHEPTPSS